MTLPRLSRRAETTFVCRERASAPFPPQGIRRDITPTAFNTVA
jgi:hypothetical protein